MNYHLPVKQLATTSSLTVTVLPGGMEASQGNYPNSDGTTILHGIIKKQNKLIEIR